MTNQPSSPHKSRRPPTSQSAKSRPLCTNRSQQDGRDPIFPHYGTMFNQHPKTQRRSRSELVCYLVLCVALFGVGYTIQTPVDSFQRQRVRMALARENKAYTDWKSNMEAEKRNWLHDRESREQQDRMEREEHEKKRHSIEWKGLQAGQCMRYGVRQYTSILSEVPLGFNAIDECWAKANHIHGRDVLPSNCEDQGYCGKAIGHWEVDFIEPDCTANWGQIVDKGCSGGFRRYDGELKHISEVDNWKAICSTMPTAHYGDVALGPGAVCSECHGRGCGSGYWATWQIYDSRCK